MVNGYGRGKSQPSKLSRERPKSSYPTSEDIQEAMERFQKEGGLVQTLPDQIVPPRNRVGGRYQNFEEI